MTEQLPQFGFGQPAGALIQYAYTVADIHAAMATWTATLGIGPWFVRGPFTPAAAEYRGRPTTPTLTLARAFSGHAMVELVHQSCRTPSVYREIIEQRGHGFHHWGVGVHDIDAEVARHAALGHEVAFADTLPSGARIRYVDTSAAVPGFVELIEMTPDQDTTYTRIHRAAMGWDGTDPVRSG